MVFSFGFDALSIQIPRWSDGQMVTSPVLWSRDDQGDQDDHFAKVTILTREAGGGENLAQQAPI
jgi:hypothetical protein